MKDGIRYYVQAYIAGKEGTSAEYSESKRESIRIARRLCGQGGFGSAASVHIAEEGKKLRLIFQCHVAKKRNDKTYVKVDEL